MITIKLRILLFFISGCSLAQAQQLRPDVLASAGNSMSDANNTARLNFTIGEVAISGQSLSSYSYGQGFHNGALQTVHVTDLDLLEWNIEVWPNPVVNMLNLQFSVPHQGDFLSASVWNLLGQPVLDEQRLDNFSPKSIAVGHLSAGVYLLRLVGPAGQCATVKFVKQL